MKNGILLVSCLIIYLILGLFFAMPTFSEPLHGGVSMLDRLPNELYGSWEVVSVQTYTNNKSLSAPMGIDYWNIYRTNDVLTLENPKTNARASVTVKSVKKNRITFIRTAKKENEEVIETPTITIVGEDFWGTDKMVMKKYKDGSLIRTDVVEFSIRGKKTGGQSTTELLN